MKKNQKGLFEDLNNPKLKRIVNSWNYSQLVNPAGSRCDEPSLTVPDRTMSLREIAIRYTHGQLPVGYGMNDGFGDEDEVNMGVDPRSLDLVEIQELSMRNQEVIDSYDSWRKSQDEDKKSKKEAARVAKMKEEWKKEQEEERRKGDAGK